MANPILREHIDTVTGVTTRALGGLHFIRGNNLPYFSLTYESIQPGRREADSCGAEHGDVVGKWPELRLLADIHLADINGVPLHAVENGWWFLATAPRIQDDGLAGSAKWCPSDKKTERHYLEIFGEHCRVTLLKAYEVKARLLEVADKDGLAVAKLIFKAWVEEQKPRWKLEASHAIKFLDLKVFGDAWKGSDDYTADLCRARPKP
jgi:hypothetical protein